MIAGCPQRAAPGHKHAHRPCHQGIFGTEWLHTLGWRHSKQARNLNEVTRGTPRLSLARWRPQGLREIATEEGALLCFDEVMTGFRIAKGCAQAHFGVTPDLTTMGKIIGGGLPVGAYGGRRDIMETVAPAGPMYQARRLPPPRPLAARLSPLPIPIVMGRPGSCSHHGPLPASCLVSACMSHPAAALTAPYFECMPAG